MTNLDQHLDYLGTHLPVYNAIIYREDLNLDCLCQMGLVMRDDGQGLEEYNVVKMMTVFEAIYMMMLMMIMKIRMTQSAGCIKPALFAETPRPVPTLSASECKL